LKLEIVKTPVHCKKCGKTLDVGNYANVTRRGNYYCPKCAPIPKIGNAKFEREKIRTIYGPNGKPLKVNMNAKP
jgi:Zn finger protein HypA/HybF involved in hydrogenase expression